MTLTTELSTIGIIAKIILFVFDVSISSGYRTEGLTLAIWRGGESEALERLHKHLDKKVNQNCTITGVIKT